MQTKLKALWEKIKGFFAKMNKATRIVLAICAAIILAAIIYAVVQMNKTEYEVLCTDLNSSDTSAVVQFLNENGAPDYKISSGSGGNKILVPEGQAEQLQIQLSTSRTLDTGFLYEFYTGNTGSFSTESERREAIRIATEEKLAAIIRKFDGVKDAWVDITLGAQRVYVLQDEATKSTAAVTIEPKSDQGIGSGVADSIRYLVAHSVQELDIGDVSIQDIYGRPYTGNSSTANIGDANALKVQFEQETNDKVRNEVLTSLSAIYGPGNVRVAVNTTVDMDRRVIESTSYSQPDGAVNGGGLIGYEKWFGEIVREDGIEAAGGVPGASTNTDISNYPDIETDLNGDENLAAWNGERKHNVNEEKEQREILAGRITDVKVAVTINQNSPNAGSLSVEQLEDHVATASGIGAIDRNDPISVGRVSVVLAPFYEKETDQPSGSDTLKPGEILPGIPNWVLYAAAGGLLLFVILLVLIILLLRRRRKKRLARQMALEEERRLAEEAAMAEAEAAAEAMIVEAEAAEAPPTGGADIMEVNTEKSMELRKLVRQFAQNNPEIAAQMVKAWLKGEDLSA